MIEDQMLRVELAQNPIESVSLCHKRSDRKKCKPNNSVCYQDNDQQLLPLSPSNKLATGSCMVKTGKYHTNIYYSVWINRRKQGDSRVIDLWLLITWSWSNRAQLNFLYMDFREKWTLGCCGWLLWECVVHSEYIYRGVSRKVIK